LCVYKPPIDTKTDEADAWASTTTAIPEIVLNFITPHQKWGIHSTYTDNLLMLTLSRGGPIVWLSEVDAPRRRGSRTTTGSRPTTRTVPWSPAPWSPSACKEGMS
jgi:nitrate reductase alpha subunit